MFNLWVETSTVNVSAWSPSPHPFSSPSSATSQLHRSSAAAPSISDLFSTSHNNKSAGRLCPYRKWHPLLRVPSGAAPKTRAKQQTITVVAALNFGQLSRAAKDSRSRRIRDLTLQFSGPTASSFGHSSLYLGKGFPPTGRRIEVGSVVIHRGLHSWKDYESDYDLAGCLDLKNIAMMCELDTHLAIEAMCTLLICVSFGNTRLIRASFGITRLICASFEIIRLIRASFGITGLIGVRVQRRADRRGARRMREGLMDVSSFLYASANEMPPRRGACRGGRGGRGRGAGRVQPEVQPVAQATDPAALVTHADLAAMEQRFRDLIMQMWEQLQQQPAPPAPAPVLVVPQVVPDQLSVEAKHLRDFRKYNPMTFDGSLEDPTRDQLWL
ncbi:gag protease polyprotein [Cucumis melo var. makuwa]|nr:gag protease polyprotein [Cucumis melo var. makuwa]